MKRRNRARTPWRKTRWAITAIFLGAASTLLYGYFGVIPRVEIDRLKTGYVQTTVDGDGVDYAIVSAAPESWVPLTEISEAARQVFVIAEDWRFYDHRGVDRFAIRKALEEAWETNSRPRGASTITQQLVKNLFLTTDYKVSRKLKEVAIAIYLDAKLTKEKIYELYLNIIEYGEGLYGISAAAGFYFQKQPAALTPKEGAFLAMLLPNPRLRAVSFEQKKLTPEAQRDIGKLLGFMEKFGYLTAEERTRELETPLSFECQPTQRLTTSE